jgi:hypothetical protein
MFFFFFSLELMEWIMRNKERIRMEIIRDAEREKWRQERAYGDRMIALGRQIEEELERQLREGEYILMKQKSCLIYYYY